MRTERDYQDATNRFDEAQHFLNSTQADRQAFIDGWRRQELEELAKARADATAVGESLAKAVRMNDLVVLTAPEDGIVLEVAKRSVGSVLQEAEPLVTMVPTGTPLIAEVMINSADVGYTKLGDEVAMKVDAFPISATACCRDACARSARTRSRRMRWQRRRPAPHCRSPAWSTAARWRWTAPCSTTCQRERTSSRA